MEKKYCWKRTDEQVPTNLNFSEDENRESPKQQQSPRAVLIMDDLHLSNYFYGRYSLVF